MQCCRSLLVALLLKSPRLCHEAKSEVNLPPCARRDLECGLAPWRSPWLFLLAAAVSVPPERLVWRWEAGLLPPAAFCLWSCVTERCVDPEGSCFGLEAIQSIGALNIWHVGCAFLSINEPKHQRQGVRYDRSARQARVLGFHSSSQHLQSIKG